MTLIADDDDAAARHSLARAVTLWVRVVDCRQKLTLFTQQAITTSSFTLAQLRQQGGSKCTL